MKYTKTKTALAIILFFGQVTEGPSLNEKFIEDDSDFSFVNKVFGNYNFGFNSAFACETETGGGGCYYENRIVIIGPRIDRSHERWLNSIRLRNALDLMAALNQPLSDEFGYDDGGGGQGNSLGEYLKESDCTDPIDLSTRDHFEVEADFVGNGELPLKIIRTYHSNSRNDDEFGFQWYSNLSPRFTFDLLKPKEITFKLFDGTVLGLYNDNNPLYGIYFSPWKNKLGKIYDLTKNSDSSWTLVSGKYTENYYSSGLLHTVQVPNGEKLTYNYIDATDKSSQIKNISHNSGQSLNFTWSNNKISKITDPAGNSYNYGYSSNGERLTSVEYPRATGTSKKTYTYTSKGLSTLVDENGDTYASWSYDSIDGGASVSRNGSGDNRGQNTYRVERPVEIDENTRTVTTVNPFNKKTIYTFKKVGDFWKKTAVSGEQLGSCAGTTRAITYDALGNKDLVTDNNGNATDYDVNADGKLVKVIEAKGTTQQRTTRFEYDSVFKKIQKSTTALAENTYLYYPSGLLKSQAIKNISSNGNQNETRTVNYSYTFHTNGLMRTKTVNGPRTDISDVITTYYNSTGYVTKITNALGHNTLFGGHNVFGNPTRITLSDGTVNRNTYNKRGWLTKTERDVYHDNRVTNYTLDKVGQITKIIKPDASVLDFEYDNAHRLTKIIRNNNQNEFKEFKYDKASNLIKEDIKNIGTTTEWVPCGTALEFDLCPITTDATITHKSDETVYDVLSRVQSVIKGGDIIAQYTYDKNDNRVFTIDGNNKIARNYYDPLDRVYRSYDRNTKSTYSYYNEHDKVVRILDPKGGNTYYKYDGFNQLLEINSPDTGITRLSYDKAGNLLQKVDGKGSIATYTYDALNRVKTEKYLGISRAFYYDQYGSCSRKGYLCQINDEAGTHKYTYNGKGELVSRTDTVSGISLTMAWTYNKIGQIKTIRHPNGMVVTYSYDALSQVSQIKSGNSVLFRNAKYKPFGPISSFYYGTAAKRDYFRDDRYRVTNIKSAGIVDLRYVFDGNSNITSAYSAYTSGSNKNRTYSYDNKDRLKTTNDFGSYDSYKYDANSNRASKGGTNYVIDGSSNRILYDGLYHYEYDDNGNITRKWNDKPIFEPVDPVTPIQPKYPTSPFQIQSAGSVSTLAKPSISNDHNYTYNKANRMTAYSNAFGGANYTYNGQGQRVKKIANGFTTYFVYDIDGKLLYERSHSNYKTYVITHKSYIYFGNELIGYTKNNILYYVQGDHLGRTEVITTTSNSKVWQAKNAAFDRQVTLDNIGGFNIGFPGQYWDAEKKSYYNYFRDYDPEIGRYLQSDPIGLAGGLNTYGYVGGNPVRFLDHRGLDQWEVDYALYNNGEYSRSYDFDHDRPQRFSEISVFGCVGIVCYYGSLDGVRATWVPPTIGGGLEFCELKQPETQCKKIQEVRSKGGIPYPVSNGNFGGTIGRYGVGITQWKDGNTCVSLGVQAGLPGPVFDAGDATP